MTTNDLSSATQIQATTKSNATNQRVLSNVRARVIELNKAASTESGEAGKSTALPDDPFRSLAENGHIIEPPFDMMTLTMLNEHSTELNQCVEAMETNIEGFGHRLIPRVKALANDDIPVEISTAVRKERVRLENFFAYCTVESFTQWRRKIRRDLEMTGNGYFEVVRSATGEIQSFVHIPSYQMRIGRLEDEMVLVDRPTLQLQEDNSVTIAPTPEWRRFRSYVQSKTIRRQSLDVAQGHRIRYFKEFGDPRMRDNVDGSVVPDGKTLPLERRANEVVHFSIYCGRSVYGLPRYIGNLLSIFGDRAAEEINFITFRNNNMPSMIVAVSNGQLTEGSIQRIESFIESQIQGSDNYSKFLILEAETLMEGEDGGNLKMDVKPLQNQQHKDALFQDYSANNQDKIRRCFRLPPIFVGRSDDYTRATAESSRQLTDEQVFMPERDEFDSFMNRVIFPHMGVLYHKFKSNGPKTTDNAQLVRILEGAERTGGMTPRVARLLLEDILGFELPDFAEGYELDVPFSVTMADAVKNMASPNEVGQQITALKSEFAPTRLDIVKQLLDARRELSKEWDDELEEHAHRPHKHDDDQDEE